MVVAVLHHKELGFMSPEQLLTIGVERQILELLANGPVEDLCRVIERDCPSLTVAEIGGRGYIDEPPGRRSFNYDR